MRLGFSLASIIQCFKHSSLKIYSNLEVEYSFSWKNETWNEQIPLRETAL